MADAVISVVVERVADIIQDQIRYQVNLLRGVEKKVQDLSKKLETIKDVLDDAEKKGPKDKSVKKWLKKLEDMAYEMDDILDEWNYTLLKYKMEDPAAVASPKQKVCCSFIPSSSLSFKKVSDRRNTAKKIQNVKDTLDEIWKEKDEFNFVISLPSTHPVPISGRVQSTSSIDLDKVCGVDIGRNKNDIVRKLLMGNGDCQIVCVVGMGGLGKTALAQLVFNDTQVKGCFDLTIWICVSDPFDVAGIARGIVESVTKENIPPNINQFELVLEKLRNCISGKKFLLVLDDVWTEKYDEWEPLKINFGYGAPGSKILVTTRNEMVANMMRRGNAVEIYHPQKLNDEDCWTLLRSISLSGRREEECGKFENVGKNIAIKCNGLPLAAKVLGSLLLNKKSLEEWENILKNEIWRLEQAEVDLFPHLLLSYDELSPALKRCFSYCAVYPKDFQINAKNLIEEWMALGYLGSVIGNGGMELKGREYFGNLAMRSLFQDFKRSSESEDEIEWCKMHDIVHDFAQFLRKNDDRMGAAEMAKRSCQACDPILVSQVQEYRSLFLDKDTHVHLCECLTSVRVLRFKGRVLNDIPKGMEKSIHLRLLELSGTRLSGEDLKIICSLYFLQTLLLKLCSIEEMPGEIGNLVELRHLDLSWNKVLEELPESICNLVELRHLDLSENEELKKLPESMCNLVELQILNIKNCPNLSKLPEGIHRLESLQQLLTEYIRVRYLYPQGIGELSGLFTLNSFMGGRSGNKLGLLKNLNRLTGSLKLVIDPTSSSDLEELVEDAREAELRNKVHIHSLSILFEDELEQSSSSSSPSSSFWMDIIEALEPNHKLKYILIMRYKGSRLPHWISSPLNLIKSIHLFDLSELSSVPPMGKLPFLEYLEMEKLEELKLLGRDFLGIECSSSSSSSTSSNHVVVAFPKLKNLRFSYCSNWSEWSDITAEEEESAAVSIMPCLMDLSIYSCDGLKKLPHRLLRKVSSSSLELMVDISKSPELQKSYGGEDGSRSLTMPCRNNPHLDIM